MSATWFRVFPALLAAIPLFGQEVIQFRNSGRSGVNGPRTMPNGYMIQFVKGTSQGNTQLAAIQAGASVRYNYGSIDAIAVTVPNENALNAFKRNGAVASIAPDF